MTTAECPLCGGKGYRHVERSSGEFILTECTCDNGRVPWIKPVATVDSKLRSDLEEWLISLTFDDGNIKAANTLGRILDGTWKPPDKY